MVKNMPAMQTWVQSLGQEDHPGDRNGYPLSILAWEIPWTEEPGGLQTLRSQRVGHDKQLHYYYIVFKKQCTSRAK